MNPRYHRIICATILALGLSSPAWSDGHMKQDLVVKEAFDGTVVALDIAEAPNGLDNLVLTIAGPRGYFLTLPGRGKTFKLDLREFGKPFDGPYRWEITGASEDAIEVNTPSDENGRTRTARKEHRMPLMVEGNFSISRGQIVVVDRDKQEEN